jgi:uncharacterized protein (TIGR02597 family)
MGKLGEENMQQAQHARGWNFLPKLTFVITIGLITAATGFQARATDVFTDPVGFVTMNPVPNGFAFIGLGLTQIPAVRGLAGTASGQQLPVNVTLTPGQFNATSEGAQYYIENVNTNSANAGFSDDIVSNDAANVYTENSDGSFIANGDGYKIYPHQTLNTVFGPQDQGGLVGSNTLANADNIFVWNPVSQTSAIYWYRTSGATPGWRGPAGVATDAGNTPLYVDQDLEVQSKYASTSNSVKLVGAVKLGNTITVVPANGFAFVGDMYATSLTFSNLDLFTGNANTGVIGSNTLANADNIFVWDPVAQSSVIYWFRTSGATPGWRGPQGVATDAGTNVLPIGCVLKIQRKYSPAFTWTLPAQY